MNKTIQSRYIKTLGEKFAPVFDDELKIHEPRVPSKDLLEYVKRRQKAQNRLDEERQRLKWAENEALDFYENKKEKKERRKDIGLMITDVWKKIIYLTWIAGTALFIYYVIQSAGSMGAFIREIIEYFSLGTTHFDELAPLGIWIAFLVVFWILSKIQWVSLRILFNLLFSVLIGGVTYVVVFINFFDW